MTSGHATVAPPHPAREAAFISPFAGWLVRAEAAADEVGAMPETAIDARSTQRPVHPASYEPMPRALYVYRQSTPLGEHTGIVGDVTVEAFLDGRVRGHESVQPDRVDGLARHLETMPQRVQLVSTLHRAGPAFRAAVARASARRPDRDVAGPDGSRHTVWRVPDGRPTGELGRELGAATHYIADGHHRVAASLQASCPAVLCVVYPLDGLTLASFDRRVAGPVDTALVENLLRASFDVHPADDVPTASTSSDIAIYLDRRWHAATFPGERPSGSAGLSVSLLHDRVLDRLPRGTRVEPTRQPLDALLAACDADGGVLFALPAPDLATLVAIADAGEVVPAKSTFFSPKPGSGIFVRGQPRRSTP